MRSLGAFTSIAVCIAVAGCDVMSPPPQPAQPAAGGAAQPAENAAAQPMEREKADVGVGQAGKSLEGEQGLIVTPMYTYFTAEQLVTFRIQVPHAMNLFKAEHGRNPKSQEEFMERIIQFNQIKLPELPPQSRYVYDPETGELLVEHPAGQ